MPFNPFRTRHAVDADSQSQTSDVKALSSLRVRGKQLGKFIIYWIQISWTDVLGMLFLAVAGNRIYEAPLASTRTFPITFTQSGDIVYPSLAYPSRGWIISPRVSGLVAALIPIVTILLAQLRIRSFWDANNAMMGVGYALLVSTVFQVIIKTLIGGFRPYFLDVCQPDISRVASHDTTGLNGVGFQGIMYTVDVCTNPDKAALRGAMMSFPSGHATAAFAGFGFLFLWMNAKLKVWANYRTSIWWLALLFAPLLAAVLQACVLTVDMAHNWYDILAGAVIGTVMAFASYRVMYASVFDWRYNHIPLRRTEVFDYPSGTGVLGLTERHVFVRKHGWGRERHGSRRGGAWLRRVLPGSGSTSTVGTARYPKPQQCPDHHATKSTPLPDRAEMQEEHQRSVVAGGEIV